MKKTNTIILLFIYSLVVSALLFDWKSAPIHFSDSTSYLEASDFFLGKGSLARFVDRPPSYPLFLVFFDLIGNKGISVYGQIVINALSIVILFLISLRLGLRLKYAIALALIAAWNGEVASYQATILTETLTVFLLLFWFLSRLWMTDKIISNKKWVTIYLLDVSLLLIKPIFIILPILSYVLLGLFQWYFKKTNLQIKKIILGIVLSFVIISGWSFLYYLDRGIFTFSSISTVNFLGKLNQYGYLRQPEKIPENIEPDLKFINKNARIDGFYDPYEIIKKLKERNIYSEKRLKIINEYFFRNRYFDFLLKSLRLTISNLSIVPEIYSNLFIYNYLPFVSYDKAVSIQNDIWLLIYILGEIGIIGILSGALILFQRRQRKDVVMATRMIMLVIVVAYVILMGTFFSYSEYGRLRVPIAHLLTLTSLWFLINRNNYLKE